MTTKSLTSISRVATTLLLAPSCLAVEANSLQLAPRLLNDVWKVAEAVGARSFKMERGFVRDGGCNVYSWAERIT